MLVSPPAFSSAHSIAARPRVAARSPMSGRHARRRRRARADAHPIPKVVGHQACASLVASFAAGVRVAGARTDDALVTPACLSPPPAALRPARCGAFGDQRRIVGGDDGGRVYRRACASLVASFGAGALLAGAQTNDHASRRRAHRQSPLRCARALRRVPDARGIVAATEAAACGRDTLGQSRRAVRFRGCHKSWIWND
jgi:hypothetical protein